MKTKLWGLLGLLCSTAQAGWSPVITGDNLTATLSYGGAAVSYSEGMQGTAGPLRNTVGQLLSFPYNLQQALNSRVAPQINQKGAAFQSGIVSGNAVITLSPSGNGVTYLTVSGLNYQITSHFSGNKWGVIKGDCTNTLTLSNITVTGQYGSVNGSLDHDKVGITANVNSSTDCDSNLSWILPIAGDWLIRKGESIADTELKNKVSESLANFKDALLFKPDQNWQIGLSRLVPSDKAIRLPNGSNFPIGQYIQNNLAYLISNSQLTLRLGNFAPLISSDPNANGGDPISYNSNVFNLLLTSPAASFSIQVNETKNVAWRWNGSFCGKNVHVNCSQP
ncbi:hypothetical protein [Chromobacterium alticapitis]|uniref:hypothetical protein n=1 Tax=Chromobacterium alticapitis TaxID=2073169 RepID=UPI0011B0C7A8|nr:hypothetical protein [Chromobacterium alticapitis]